jgi:hypothetical protein
MPLRARHTEFDGVTFDSIAEASFYKALKARFRGEIATQYEVTLIPPCEGYKAEKWKVDFALIPTGWVTPRLLIEYKGGWVASNRGALKLLRLQLHLYQRECSDIPLVITGDKVAERCLKAENFQTVHDTLQKVATL